MSARECTCISYNRPEPHQTTQSAVLQPPDWVPMEAGRTVCVDACIAHIIKALWDARIWTLNSCCGHNGQFMRSVIVDREDRARAEAVIADLDDDMIVQTWELVPSDAKP